jgi:hypothetical protein
MPGPSLIDRFAALEDLRQSWKVLFALPGVLLLVLCGTLAGAENFVEIRRWGQMHQDFLRRLLPFKAGVPSHDTLNDVIKAIDGALFAQCFTAWVEGLRHHARHPRITGIAARIWRELGREGLLLRYLPEVGWAGVARGRVRHLCILEGGAVSPAGPPRGGGGAVSPRNLRGRRRRPVRQGI